jgi:hypothetical protein
MTHCNPPSLVNFAHSGKLHEASKSRTVGKKVQRRDRDVIGWHLTSPGFEPPARPSRKKIPEPGPFLYGPGDQVRRHGRVREAANATPLSRRQRWSPVHRRSGLKNYAASIEKARVLAVSKDASQTAQRVLVNLARGPFSS